MNILDVEEVRDPMIKFVLNQEIFYTFPISYNISLLNKISSIFFSDEVKRLAKTIQINLSLTLTRENVNSQTLRKLQFRHSVIPIYH